MDIRPHFALSLFPCLLFACAAAPSARPEVQQTGPLAEHLRALVAGLVETYDLPGATAAVTFADGSTISVAAGLADVDQGTRLKPGASMLAGSTGKTFFVAAALRLSESEQIDLDRRRLTDCIDAPWVEDLPNGDRVTLRQLLRHTSGVPEHVYDPRLLGPVASEPDRVLDTHGARATARGSRSALRSGRGMELR